MPRKPIIAVIGGQNATPKQEELAYKVGRLIAEHGWVLINGGLTGVMEAASRGANKAGGVVIGILPTPTVESANPYVTYPIATNMGHARNVIICHTADAFIAVGGEEGTLAEIAVARKLKKPVASLQSWDVAQVHVVSSPEEAITWIESNLKPQTSNFKLQNKSKLQTFRQRRIRLWRTKSQTHI